MKTATMDIEVILALPGRCWRRTVTVAVGTPAEKVLRHSGLDRVCAQQTGAGPERLGVFGRKVAGNYPIQPGERLELYRPLRVDPRQRRRSRAVRGDYY